MLLNDFSVPEIFKVLLLFFVTACAEIVGCYLPYLWLKEDKSIWLLVPAGLSLALFVWLLSLHPQAAARVYAAYGGVYIVVAIGWLYFAQSIKPLPSDYIGLAVCLLGSVIIISGATQSQ